MVYVIKYIHTNKINMIILVLGIKKDYIIYPLDKYYNL